jgi:hypothetical protein
MTTPACIYLLTRQVRFGEIISSSQVTGRSKIRLSLLETFKGVKGARLTRVDTMDGRRK